MTFGFVFCVFLMKETMGLTDKEKKKLYLPTEDYDVMDTTEMST